MTDCVLVTTVGKSPGTVTTAIDALADEGHTVRYVYCLALPASGVTAQAHGGLFRDEMSPVVTHELGPLVRELARAEATGTGLRAYWRVVNVGADDLMTPGDNLTFYRACAQVLVEAERTIEEDAVPCGWFCLSGGRKSMSALLYSAAVMFAPRLLPCHVVLAQRIEDIAAGNAGDKQVMHPPSAERTLVKLPKMRTVHRPCTIDELARLLQQIEAVDSVDAVSERLASFWDQD